MASKEVLTALETLHRELEKLEPAIKHVELAQQVTKMVEGIPQKTIDLVNAIKETDLKHKGELEKLFSKELTVLVDENNKNLKTTTEIQSLVKEELHDLSKLKDTVRDFYDRIGKIHFPQRLDKLDANVAGIMAAIQSIQSRLDSLERNIIDRLKDMDDFQKNTRSGLHTAIEQFRSSIEKTLEDAAKKQQTNTYITWALIVIGVVAIIIVSKLG